MSKAAVLYLCVRVIAEHYVPGCDGLEGKKNELWTEHSRTALDVIIEGKNLGKLCVPGSSTGHTFPQHAEHEFRVRLEEPLRESSCPKCNCVNGGCLCPSIVCTDPGEVRRAFKEGDWTCSPLHEVEP